jgi:hypothetical protein
MSHCNSCCSSHDLIVIEKFLLIFIDNFIVEVTVTNQKCFWINDSVKASESYENSCINLNLKAYSFRLKVITWKD